jgi:folate-binding protein YgfZ
MKQWQGFYGKQSNARVSENFLCAADELGLILVNGADAREFLQNQLSNDIDFIDESQSQLSSYSTPKGRMLGIFRVVQVSNGYLLITARSMVLPLLEILYKYIVQAQVTLADASNYFARIVLQTDCAEVIEHPLLPAEVGAVLQNDSVISLQLEPLGSQQRYLLMCLSADEAIELWNDFADPLQVAGFSSWRLAEIKVGLPIIYPQTMEQFVLQMANLGVLGGVSFKKGCYPGQEIVARMEYLGKLKRRMFLARIDSDTLPLPGDELVARGKTDIDGSGKIVDAEFDPDGVCHCLYIAQISKADAGNLQLLDQPQSKIQNLDLPYSFDNLRN